MSVTIAEVTNASLEVLSQMVNLNLQRQLVMPGKLLDSSSDAVKGVKQVKIRKFGDLAAVQKLPGVDLVFQGSTLTTDDIDLDQHFAVPFEFEKFARIQGPQAFYEELAQNAAIKLAEKMDDYFISVVDAGAATSALPTVATIDKDAFIKARQLLNVAKVPNAPRWVGIHPDDYAEVLKVAQFVEAEKYGTSNVASGEVGRIFGMTVIENIAFTPGELLAWHQGCAATAVQLTPDVNYEYSVAKLADLWALDTIYGAVMIKSASAIKLS